MGIITHDDIIDVVREEAAEDAYRMAAVEPLDMGYLEAPFWRLVWNRGIWLAVLLVGSVLTAVILSSYQTGIADVPWLVFFIPMVVSVGGNTGSQSATLIITALKIGDVSLSDWWRVIRREIVMGVVLGAALGIVGYFCASAVLRSTPGVNVFHAAAVIPISLLLVATCGTLFGSLLPLIFHRLGLDPAIMSNPFVAGLNDVTGIIIYMQVINFMHMG